MSDAGAASVDAFYDDRFLRETTFGCGGQVVVTGRMEATASPFAHIWTLQDGQVVAREEHVPGAEDPVALSVALAIYRATGDGDQAAVAALLDPEVEWRIPAELPYGGVFHGPTGVMESRAIANDVFVPGQQFTPEHVFASGGQVVGIGRMEAVVQRTGAPVRAPFMHIWTVRGGKVVTRRQFTDTETILAALAAA